MHRGIIGVLLSESLRLLAGWLGGGFGRWRCRESVGVGFIEFGKEK